ncbi:t-SNARE [Nadsonia fulvescens var. elongata DSM 6958]|uniref:Probable 26S proteasome regulatory subunit p27 n=1 Tax=Nadsonia fulvescens var. elongata DSM 6958 TaxID=857566 RepID=A0A1E3PKM4_9ASCO|nr:t-SNARE [Nadsonia fulvescens var. elongata DSM 6958]
MATHYDKLSDYGQGNPYAENDYAMSDLTQADPFAMQNTSYGGNQDNMIEFFAEIDEIKHTLVQFDDNIERIEALHKRSLNEVSEEGEDWTQKQLTAMSEETATLSQTLRNRIKNLESRSQRDTTKKTQTENVKMQFMNSIQQYQSIEAHFRQRYRERAERQFRIVRPEATDSEVQEALEDSTGTQIFSSALLSSNRRGEARTALSEVQNRHREIQKIEKTMSELAQLFHDMEILVAEQEAPIQHVDDQAQLVQNDIEQGVSHTTKAVKSARAARKKKWWCFGIFCPLYEGNTASNPSTDDSTVSNQKVMALMAKRQNLEETLNALMSVLESHKVDMHTKLVTSDGFPRSDLDVAQIRTTRAEIIKLRNDLQDLSKEIEAEVFQYWEKMKEKNQELKNQENEEILPSLNTRNASSKKKAVRSNLIPYARVNSVAAGSPAFLSGLLPGDRILRFGKYTAVNHEKLTKIGSLVRSSEGVPIEILVLRVLDNSNEESAENEDEEVTLTLTPSKDANGSMLGCHLVLI